MKKTLILMGSHSDAPIIAELKDLLTNAKVPYEVEIASCHRDLDGLYQLLTRINNDQYRAVVAIANSVSNMPAIVAGYLKGGQTIVIGVGLDDKGMNGIDSLLSINTIPRGVPLVTTGIGKTGLYNAGLFVTKLYRT